MHNVFRALVQKKVWDLKVRRSIQLSQSRPKYPDHWRRVIEIRRAGHESRELHPGFACADNRIALPARISWSGRAGGIVPPTVASVSAGASGEGIDSRAVAFERIGRQQTVKERAPLRIKTNAAAVSDETRFCETYRAERIHVRPDIVIGKS